MVFLMIGVQWCPQLCSLKNKLAMRRQRNIPISLAAELLAASALAIFARASGVVCSRFTKVNLTTDWEIAPGLTS